MSAQQKEAVKATISASKRSTGDVPGVPGAPGVPRVPGAPRVPGVPGVAFSDHVVYCLSRRPVDNIVDLVLQLMDEEDGPRPMKNLKPAQKNRTGADQFYLEHQAEYEARGQQSRDQVGRVLAHNTACPKMHDELNKRKSTSKPTACISQQNISASKKSIVKAKKQVKVETRKKRTRPRYNRNYGPKYPRDTRAKITKNKRPQRRYRSPSKLYKLSKIRMNKGCQCTCYYVPAETKSVSTFNEFVSMPQEMMTTVNNFASIQNYETNHTNVTGQMQAVQKSSKKTSKSVLDSGNRETSAPSISSYNSFMSMDHEPMVE